ncbi:hypothetical protein GCM10007385_13410 [Tateyamaria omphalii]|nr:hypothetical protein GCM10007385_13410 [Tateyamaria omphalii]
MANYISRMPFRLQENHLGSGRDYADRIVISLPDLSCNSERSGSKNRNAVYMIDKARSGSL